MTEYASKPATVRWGGAAGIGFAVLFIAGLTLIQGTPHYDATDQEWVAWFHDSGHRSGQVAGLFVLAAAVLLFIVFSALLVRRAQAAGASGDTSAVAAIAATVVAVAVMVAGAAIAAISAAVTFAPNNFPVPSADVARTLEQLGFGTLLVGGGWSAALFVAAATRALQTAALMPKWLVVAGYVLAVLLLASFLFIPLLLLPLWALVTGIVTITRPATSAATGRP